MLTIRPFPTGLDHIFLIEGYADGSDWLLRLPESWSSIGASEAFGLSGKLFWVHLASGTLALYDTETRSLVASVKVADITKFAPPTLRIAPR